MSIDEAKLREMLAERRYKAWNEPDSSLYYSGLGNAYDAVLEWLDEESPAPVSLETGDGGASEHVAALTALRGWLTGHADVNDIDLAAIDAGIRALDASPAPEGVQWVATGAGRQPTDDVWQREWRCTGCGALKWYFDVPPACATCAAPEGEGDDASPGEPSASLAVLIADTLVAASFDLPADGWSQITANLRRGDKPGVFLVDRVALVPCPAVSEGDTEEPPCITMTPGVRSGWPCINGSRLDTKTLAEIAERYGLADAAREYEIPEEAVRLAIDYESGTFPLGSAGPITASGDTEEPGDALRLWALDRDPDADLPDEWLQGAAHRGWIYRHVDHHGNGRAAITDQGEAIIHAALARPAKPGDTEEPSIAVRPTAAADVVVGDRVWSHGAFREVLKCWETDDITRRRTIVLAAAPGTEIPGECAMAKEPCHKVLVLNPAEPGDPERVTLPLWAARKVLEHLPWGPVGELGRARQMLVDRCARPASSTEGGDDVA